MKKIICLVAVIAYSITNVYSQTGEVKRINLNEDLGNGGIVNLYKHGLAIKTQKGAECEFTFYDENLKKNGSCNLSFENKREYVSDYYYDTVINKILVFHTYKRINNLTLIAPDTKKKKTVVLTLPGKKSYMSTSFVSLEKSIYLVATAKGKTSLNTINLANGNISPVDMPEVWKARVILKMSRVNAKYAALFYLDKSVKNKKFKNVALIDDEGNVVADKLVENNKDDFPIEEFSITDLGGEQLAIAGTYSASVSSEYSIGLFVAKIDNLKLSYMKYFTYNEIKNFYNFMSEKKKEKAPRPETKEGANSRARS